MSAVGYGNNFSRTSSNNSVGSQKSEPSSIVGFWSQRNVTILSTVGGAVVGGAVGTALAVAGFISMGAIPAFVLIGLVLGALGRMAFAEREGSKVPSHTPSLQTPRFIETKEERASIATPNSLSKAESRHSHSSNSSQDSKPEAQKPVEPIDHSVKFGHIVKPRRKRIVTIARDGEGQHDQIGQRPRQPSRVADIDNALLPIKTTIRQEERKLAELNRKLEELRSAIASENADTLPADRETRQRFLPQLEEQVREQSAKVEELRSQDPTYKRPSKVKTRRSRAASEGAVSTSANAPTSQFLEHVWQSHLSTIQGTAKNASGSSSAAPVARRRSPPPRITTIDSKTEQQEQFDTEQALRKNRKVVGVVYPKVEEYGKQRAPNHGTSLGIPTRPRRPLSKSESDGALLSPKSGVDLGALEQQVEAVQAPLAHSTISYGQGMVHIDEGYSPTDTGRRLTPVEEEGPLLRVEDSELQASKLTKKSAATILTKAQIGRKS